MKEGDVILASLSQADGNRKTRPVICLREMPSFDDMLVCGISTKLRHEISGFDELISQVAHDFQLTGLRETSLIRLSFLGILSTKDLAGSLGSISPERHRRLLERLSEYLVV